VRRIFYLTQGHFFKQAIAGQSFCGYDERGQLAMRALSLGGNGI
jgi:hypothetical protein